MPRFNKANKTVICAALLVLSGLTSSAAEPVVKFSSGNRPGKLAALTAATATSQKTSLDYSELAKYQSLDRQSQILARHHAAGASSTTKTVLVTVGVVVVVLGVLVLVATHGGKTAYHPSGNGF